MNLTSPSPSPSLKGGLLALLAASLFGMSTPLVQHFAKGMGALTTAALLYAGAALIAAVMRRPAPQEAQIQRGDLPRLLGMAGMGAVIGPVALVWGLQKTSGSSAALMLTLEAVFTALLAWRWYGETLDRKVALAVGLMTVGGVVLVLEQTMAGEVQLLGLMAVMLATAAWGVDNTLSRGVADRDPGQVVLVKSLLGVMATSTLAWVMDEPFPQAGAVAAVLAIGASGYGLSLRFYLLAQRAFGAARTGSLFAFAPFIGAAGALLLGERSVSWLMAVAGMLLMAGVLLHLAETHAHQHHHAVLEHEHAHSHNDGHHFHHHHDHLFVPPGKHSHWHRHEPLTHSHAHVPDAHHRHTHAPPQAAQS